MSDDTAIDMYEVSIELVPLRGSEFFGEFAGVGVFMYVPAASIRDALNRAENEAESQHYEVIDLDHCVRVDLDHYVPHDEDYPEKSEIEEALRLDTILYGPFLGYESETEH